MTGLKGFQIGERHGPAATNALKKNCTQCTPHHPYNRFYTDSTGITHRFCNAWASERRRQRKLELKNPKPKRIYTGALAWIYNPSEELSK
jgi:hypothetical protein